MNHDAKIHPGALADVPQIAILMKEYWSFEGIAGFDSGRVAQLLEHLLLHPQLGAIWIARVDSEPVGYLIVVFVLSFEYQGLVAEIDELFVLPQARFHGIGTALLAVAEGSLAGGCSRMQLQLGSGNRAARTFYHRHGYALRSGYELLDKHLTST